MITTEAITAEMLDTGIPSLDNNNADAAVVTEAATAIETDSPVPVKRDELLDDDTTNTQDSPEVPSTSTDTTEEEQNAADIGEDTQNPKDSDEQQPLSGPEEPENVNENADSESKSEESAAAAVDDDEEEQEKVDEEKPTTPAVVDDEKDDVEINESIVVNQDAEDAAVEELEELLNAEEVVAEAIVKSVAEKLSIAVADEETDAAPATETSAETEDDSKDEEKADDEVEKIVSADDNVDVNEDDSERAAEQKPSNQEKHSLREDVSSSDDEDGDGDEKADGEEKEQSDTPKNEGLENEWGGLSDAVDAAAAAADNDKNILTNEIDLYESVPIDLSNDIAVNDIMADQGAPAHPDAEVFDVEELKAQQQQRDVIEESSRIEVLADAL